jgi:hypothetical protein
MKRDIVWLISSLALLFLAPATAQAGPDRSPVVLDSNGNVRSFYGVPVTLTRSDLKRLPFRVKARDEPGGEGGPYRVYVITAQEGVRVEVTFDRDGKLYNAWTESPNAVGPKGVRIGSTLADAKAAWPNGDSLFYFEDGYVATYRTRSNVSFMFDPKDLPRGTFDHDAPWDFPIPDTIKVKTIAVFPKPAPPRPVAPPPIDENKSWMTEEASGDHQIIRRAGGGSGDETLQARTIISRLDVEQTPGTQLVRLVWTHEGKLEADRLIDVSAYPEFDIWTRERVWRPDKVVTFSFRYGHFKDCASLLDDRDKVYVTLNGDGAILSSDPPPGVQVDNRWALTKFVGHSMNSAAHGCRRTYNPHTGAFGLERDE